MRIFVKIRVGKRMKLASARGLAKFCYVTFASATAELLAEEQKNEFSSS